MNLNVIANINSLSYGVVSFYILKTLNDLGINVALFCPKNCDLSAYQDQNYEFIKKFIDNTDNFDCNVPSLTIYHQNNLAGSIGRGKRFAYSFFELDKFNQREINHINSLDGFFVGSHWAKEVCEKNNIQCPVHVAPPSLDEKLINIKSYNKNYDIDPIIFATVGKWEKRKGHLEIIEAFEKTFDPFDNIELHMYCGNSPDLQSNYKWWIDRVDRSPLSNLIKIMPFIKSHKEMIKKIAESDVYLSFSHAEGFDLPLYEAMRQGVLCIATNSTAHMEYVRKDNCLLIEPIGKEQAFDGKWFVNKDQEFVWDKYNFEDFLQKIKKSCGLIQNKEYNKIVENAVAVTSGFSWIKSVEKMLKIMNKKG